MFQSRGLGCKVESARTKLAVQSETGHEIRGTAGESGGWRERGRSWWSGSAVGGRRSSAEDAVSSSDSRKRRSRQDRVGDDCLSEERMRLLQPSLAGGVGDSSSGNGLSWDGSVVPRVVADSATIAGVAWCVVLSCLVVRLCLSICELGGQPLSLACVAKKKETWRRTSTHQPNEFIRMSQVQPTIASKLYKSTGPIYSIRVTLSCTILIDIGTTN